jgi:hypothetical protein
MNAGIDARTGASASADASVGTRGGIGAGEDAGAGAGTDAGIGARTGARTGASASADASARARGGIGAGDDAGARTGASVGEGTSASSVDAKSWIGWADTGLDVSEMVVVESNEDGNKLGQDIPEEEVVAVGEVDWAGAGGANAVTRRPECCVVGGSAERGQTADTALLRDIVDSSCSREDAAEVE